MTRPPPRITLICPNCSKEAPSTFPSSTNNFGWRQWSDGWGEGSCSRTRSGLIYCAICRYVFPKASCKWRHADGTNSTTELRELCATYGQHSGLSARDALSDGRWLEEETEYLLRLQWWWDWNHNARRGAPSAEWVLSFPLSFSLSGDAAIPTDLFDNLERLLQLLGSSDRKFFSGEILRRLGRFDEAEEFFNGDTVARPEWRTLLAKLSAYKKSGIVELSLPQMGQAGSRSF